MTAFFVSARNAAQLITRNQYIGIIQKSIQEVTWHQWRNVIVGENNTNEGAQKLLNENEAKSKKCAENKECVDRVINRDVINKEHSKNDTGSMPNKKQDKKRRILDKVR